MAKKKTKKTTNTIKQKKVFDQEHFLKAILILAKEHNIDIGKYEFEGRHITVVFDMRMPSIFSGGFISNPVAAFSAFDDDE